MATASAIGSGGTGRFGPFQPLSGAPTEGTVVIQIPPREPIGDLGTADDAEYGSVLQRLYRLITETGAAAQAKAESSGVSDSDVVSEGCGIHGGLHGIRGLDGRKQGWLQACSVEVLFTDGTKHEGCSRGRVEVPLYPSTCEVLCDHAGLDREFAYRRAEAF